MKRNRILFYSPKRNNIFQVGIGLMFLFLSQISSAQDINFSQFQLSPMQTNPAMISSSNQFQLIFNYRNQFVRSGTTFNTPMFTATAPIINKKKGKRLAGIGLSFVNDAAGENGILQTTGANLGFAFNIPHKLPEGLSVIYDSYLSIGVSGGYFQRGINVNQITTGSQWITGIGFFDPSLPINESFPADRITYPVFNAGAFWHLEDTSEVIIAYLGFSVQSLNQPNVAFLSNTEDKLPITFSATGGFDLINGYRFSLQPNIRWIQNQKSTQINAGTLLRYRLGNGGNGFLQESNVNMGLWYSTTNGVIVSAGFYQPRLFMNFSYDMGSLVNKEIPAGSAALEFTVGLKFGKRRIFKPADFTNTIAEEDSINNKINEDSIANAKNNVVPDSIIKSNIPKDLTIFKYNAYFYFMTDTINHSSAELLDDMAAQMKIHKDIKIEIIGHTCDIGKDSQVNNLLSLRRAEKVKQYLLSKGIESERMLTSGYGATRPIASNKTEFGKIKNRRVEFKILSGGE